MVCLVCGQKVGKVGYKIMCSGDCQGWFHLGCTSVTADQAKNAKTSPISWNCKQCSKQKAVSLHQSDSSSEDDSNGHRNLGAKAKTELGNKNKNKRRSIISSPGEHVNKNLAIGSLNHEDSQSDSNLTQIVNMMKREFADMKNSLKFMNELLEEEISKNKTLTKAVEDLNEDNKLLKKELSYVSAFVNNQAYQKVKNNLVITGICKNANEPPVQIERRALSVLQCVDGGIQRENIKHIKVQPTKSDRCLVVVTLESEVKKTSILKNRKQVGVLTGQKCNISECGNIYLNEELPPVTLNLLREANQLKNIGFSFVWSRNGSIYARQREGSDAFKIYSTYQVREIFKSAKQ